MKLMTPMTPMMSLLAGMTGWLICNNCKSFKTYQLENDTTVAGIGNVKTNVKGHGVVELISTYNGCAYSMKLTNILHIPSNRNNLLSLG